MNNQTQQGDEEDEKDAIYNNDSYKDKYLTAHKEYKQGIERRSHLELDKFDELISTVEEVDEYDVQKEALDRAKHDIQIDQSLTFPEKRRLLAGVKIMEIRLERDTEIGRAEAQAGKKMSKNPAGWVTLGERLTIRVTRAKINTAEVLASIEEYAALHAAPLVATYDSSGLRIKDYIEEAVNAVDQIIKGAKPKEAYQQSALSQLRTVDYRKK